MTEQIMTVLGPISQNDLGLTSMHEHVMIDLSVWRNKNLDLIPADLPISDNDPVSLENLGLLRCNNFLVKDNKLLDDESLMTSEVADFKASGGSAMVEMSCHGIRLDLPAIRRISQKTGVHIIATTGMYVEDSWPEFAREMTVKQLKDLMIKEIQEDIDDTGIKAGHIGELGTSTLSEREVRLLRAGAQASIETGLSVSIHQGADVDGCQTVDILTREGMDPQRIIMGHADRYFVEHRLDVLISNPDKWSLKLDRAKQLLDRGVNISIDCFGHSWDQELSDLVMTTDWQRMAGLITLLNQGYGAQIVLATDTCMKMLTRRYGGEGYCRLTNYILPTLKKLGVSQSDVDQMMLHNPSRLLTN